MSLEERFNDEERLLLHTLPSLIGAAVAYSSDNGPLGTAKEMMATAKAVVRGRTRYDDNEIIESVLPSIEDQDEALAEGKEIRAELMNRLEEKGVNSREAMADQAVADAAIVADALDSKATPDEAAEYREWCMEVAMATAKAAREGGVLGIGGQRVGAGERDTMERIADAFGAQPPTE